MQNSSSAQLNWQVEQDKLIIKGQLTRETLQGLYDEKKQFAAIKIINVSGLTHVDSSGLALLTQLCLMSKTEKKQLEGINDKLHSLIQAYRLPL